jgi:ATP-binding cassette subfamily B protein
VETLRQGSLSLAKVDAVFQPLTLLLIGLSTLLAVCVGSWQAIEGNVTQGNIAEFVIYINLITWPITSIGWVAGMVQRAAASQKRINEFLNEQPAVRTDLGVKTTLKGGIEVSNVRFSYPGSEKLALENISFTVQPGQTLGIVGRTGSGKTTLLNLLMRVYEPTGGSILYDHKNLMDLNLGYLREQAGYVPQDVFLFSDTLANNIAFGAHNATTHQIEEAAQNADVLKDILRFKDGFSTVVGERGVTLSGGQKQRVAIARALIRKPTVFFFDDCLAAVDTQTEQAILGRLREMTKSITTLIVSHRVSSVLHADWVVVLENGQIVEQGKPGGLIEQNGIFAETYRKQQEEATKHETN